MFICVIMDYLLQLKRLMLYQKKELSFLIKQISITKILNISENRWSSLLMTQSTDYLW